MKLFELLQPLPRLGPCPSLTHLESQGKRDSGRRALGPSQREVAKTDVFSRGACLRLDRKRASKKNASSRDGPPLNRVTFPA